MRKAIEAEAEAWNRKRYADIEKGTAEIGTNAYRGFIAGASAHERLLSEERDTLRAENEKMRSALESISKNSCCGQCQEAKLVAKQALADGGEE